VVKRKTTTGNEPWEQEPPLSAQSKKSLSPAAKSRAKARAKRAGRPYPNLVDNMREAAKSKGGTTRKRRAPAAKRTSAQKQSGRKAASTKSAANKSAPEARAPKTASRPRSTQRQAAKKS